MCLSRVYRGKEKQEALAKLPKIGRYWKAVATRKKKYYPSWKRLPNNQPFKSGWNAAKSKYEGEGYNLCFHFYRYRKFARKWAGTTIQIKVQKKDIVAIGTQRGGLCIVAKRIWIPKPKK